ncbi:MAG: hypothetical protein JWO38_8338 [Gemmataceae bacterium]|nr:hypothetical protein [Gemmataceae bacterium]
MSTEPTPVIHFRCPGCRARLRVPDGPTGREATCPRCRKAVSVPTPGPLPVAQLDEADPPRGRRLPGWVWAVGGAAGAGLAAAVTVAVVLSVRGPGPGPDGRVSGPLAPGANDQRTESAVPKPAAGEGKRTREIRYNFSPFLPEGVAITDLKADGPFLTGRIRSAKFPLESGQIRVTFLSDKFLKLDEVIAVYPDLRPGEVGEISVLSFQLDRAARASFHPF